MKVQSINRQRNYNNPVCFTSEEKIIRAVNAPLVERNLEKPSVLKKLIGILKRLLKGKNK